MARVQRDDIVGERRADVVHPQLSEVMRDAIIFTDADRRITSWNPAAEAMEGGGGDGSAPQ